MKTTIKEITPQWAAQILETKNIQNRNISDRTVEKYARDMENGDWCLTHQGIALDVNGDLLDGQHRLAAVIRSKKTVRMMVTFGVPNTFQNNGHKTDTFTCIDGVRPRGAGVALEILKYKNSTLVASTARGMAILCSLDSKTAMTAAITERVVKLASPSIERTASLSCGSKIIKVRSAALSAIAFYHTSHPELAEKFLIDTQTVSGPKGSPSRALATWMNNHANMGGGMASLNLAYVTCSALFHESRKATVEKLYGSEDGIRWLHSTNPALKKQISSLLE